MTIAPDRSNADELLDAIEAAVADGNASMAMSLSVDALEKGIDDPIVLLLSAEHFELQGNPRRSIELLRQATLLAPDEAEVWRRLGGTLARQEMLDEALKAFEQSLAIEPNSFATLVVAGAASFRSAQLGSAYAYYRRALALSPDEPELMATLALIAARLEHEEEAQELAERALAKSPGSVNAGMASARVDMLRGHLEQAQSRMTTLLDEASLGNEERVAAYDLRAEIRDRLDCASGAFADYAARNAILKRLYSPLAERDPGERRIDQVRRLRRFFEAAAPSDWKASNHSCVPEAGRPAAHVFLVGFPRSGTTLLEKAMASHPNVVTLEEIDILGAVGNPFLSSNESLCKLRDLGASARDAYCEQYWKAVRASLGCDLAGKVLVDKLPLHTLALPAIARLFHGAKILFALRDPRDVVLSCFRRRFRMNSAMFEFLTLEGTARYYDEVMRLARLYRGLLALDIRDVRHETVVADFDRELAATLKFAGLAWDPAVRTFAERAKRRARTPSDLQLTRGLTSEGVGQWKRYAEQLKPVMPLLERWIAHYGY